MLISDICFTKSLSLSIYCVRHQHVSMQQFQFFMLCWGGKCDIIKDVMKAYRNRFPASCLCRAAAFSQSELLLFSFLCFSLCLYKHPIMPLSVLQAQRRPYVLPVCLNPTERKTNGSFMSSQTVCLQVRTKSASCLVQFKLQDITECITLHTQWPHLNPFNTDFHGPTVGIESTSPFWHLKKATNWNLGL